MILVSNDTTVLVRDSRDTPQRHHHVQRLDTILSSW